MPAAADAAPVKIALFMEDELARYGVEGMLRGLPSVAGVTSYGSGAEALRAGADSYDLVVLPGSALAAAPPDGISPAAGDGGPPPVRLLVLTYGAGAGEVPDWASPLVLALLDWSGLTPAVLGDAVVDVMDGKFYLSPSLARQVLRPAGRQPGPPGSSPLTPRESQVLLLLAEGLSNKQLARQLEVSEHGVKRLVSSVLAKLNCPNRTLAVVRGIERGLLPGPART
jgi:DNA-binding NarL/FixJ family response regulator